MSVEQVCQTDVATDILYVIERAVANAGYKILDGDHDTIFIRRISDDAAESHYQVKVEEIIP